jgi:hypothetical protein
MEAPKGVEGRRKRGACLWPAARFEPSMMQYLQISIIDQCHCSILFSESKIPLENKTESVEFLRWPSLNLMKI